MTIYDEETLANFEVSLGEIRSGFDPLREQFLLHQYRSERGYEFASHGFCRRLSQLLYSLETVFETLPPDRKDIPEKEETQTATMAIHSFVTNVSGCIDNLAWIWMHEADVRGNDGNPIAKREVGFGNENNRFRQSLPHEFQKYLETRKEWLDHAKNFRDSLAHRIPLYIPPFSIDPKNVDAYEALEEQRKKALKDHNFDEYYQLEKEQEKLCHFKPVMSHSFSENSPIAYFHAQMIADYLTVEEFAKELLKTLQTLTPGTETIA